ncbi:hypothetical protein MRQ36_02875 [Micromonospora sp. R77]|uniref:hypothetical protein n=1 Tax=Micromonospora sp. R77 TaxID=2925836 RepID=UPI001F61BF3C|nr:hypothetical protein [Micromonospora sp. R77]MCI4061572.1 hypothetical protein [Micromonospora sp. R77]
MRVLIHPRSPYADVDRPAATGACPMSRYVAPLGFTLAAVWVAVLFVLAGGGH